MPRLTIPALVLALLTGPAALNGMPPAPGTEPLVEAEEPETPGERDERLVELDRVAAELLSRTGPLVPRVRDLPAAAQRALAAVPGGSRGLGDADAGFAAGCVVMPGQSMKRLSLVRGDESSGLLAIESGGFVTSVQLVLYVSEADALEVAHAKLLGPPVEDLAAALAARPPRWTTSRLDDPPQSAGTSD